ncbi:hypothetical protein [Streptomyces sioyaensis]|uniref:hypothetical protein n=1 Tax=Streptomyces sioyaensis TaxID=67364 RepID=UPI0036E3ECCC
MPTVRSVELTGRTFGGIHADQFRIADTELGPLKPGSALLENVYLLIEPEVSRLVYGGWHLHTPMPGGPAIGRVIDSRTRALPIGTVVLHAAGWSTHAVVWAGQSGLRVISASADLPVTVYLWALGAPGMTAWRGVHEILRPQRGEVLYVASGVNAAGSLVAQLARLCGAGPLLAGVRGEVAARVATQVYGFDEAYDTLESAALGRLAGPSAGLIDAAWVDLDTYHLSVVANSLRQRGGRIAHAGRAVRADGVPIGPGPATRETLVDGRRVVIHEYPSSGHGYAQEAMHACLVPLIRAGRIALNETFVHGFDHVVQAFLGTLRGDLTGPVIARIADL